MKLPPEHSDLDFLAAMADVTPRKPSNRVFERMRLRPTPAPRSTVTPESIPIPWTDHGVWGSPEIAEVLEFRRNGVQDSQFKKLASGRLIAGLSLDLHGMNREAARTAVWELLTQAQTQHQRCVCIVHGKGSHAHSSGVLKPLLACWLQQAEMVLAYCSAPPHLGGTGALLVLLKQTRR